MAAKTPAERLREYRRKLNLTQTDLARLCELSQAQVSQYETGERRPELAAAVRIEEITGIPAKSWLPRRPA